MDKYKTAYFAGLIDGEGSIGYMTGGVNKPRVLTIEVKMTCKKTIEAIHHHFGVGSILFRPSKNPRWKDQWRWRATAKSARFVISEIEEFLITKKHLV